MNRRRSQLRHAMYIRKEPSPNEHIAIVYLRKWGYRIERGPRDGFVLVNGGPWIKRFEELVPWAIDLGAMWRGSQER